MLRISVGDVFTIPVDDRRVGIGQVFAIYEKKSYFMAVFDRVVAVESLPEVMTEALGDPVVFVTCSFDARFIRGGWKVIANSPVSPSIPFPAYRELYGLSRVMVVDYSGTRKRKATPQEAEELSDRTMVTPIVLERALRAHVGLEPWLDAFESLRVENVVPSSRFFDS